MKCSYEFQTYPHFVTCGSCGSDYVEWISFDEYSKQIPYNNDEIK
jgi:hypothetical protein